MRNDMKRWRTGSGGRVMTMIFLALAVGLALAGPLISTAQGREAVESEPSDVAGLPQPSRRLADTSLGQLSDAFAEIAASVRPAVVFVDAEGSHTVSAPAGRFRSPRDPFEWFFSDPGGSRRGFGDRPMEQPFHGMGSGFILSSDGYVVTNDHVVEDATNLTVRLLDGREFDARVVGHDPNTDIAVLKVDAEDLPAVALGDSDALDIGEWVLAIGNPMGEEFSFTVTEGIVSAKGRGLQGLQTAPYGIQDFIQTDAVINPGNSGGPLVNTNGEVVGINTAIASPTGYYMGYGFAIPINLARLVADQLIETGHVTRAILGVTISAATREDTDYVGLNNVAGVVVQSLGMDSPAGDAGLELGDVIIALDGAPIRSVAQLQSDVGFRSPGDEVELTVARHGKRTRTYTVTLGRAPLANDGALESAAHVPEDISTQNLLGIAVVEVPAETLRREGISVDGGAALGVAAVSPDGPARGHLLKGDIVEAVNGNEVQREVDFEKALRSVAPGEVVSLTIERPLGDGTAITRVVRLRAPHDS